jgi:glucuronate isomerase
MPNALAARLYDEIARWTIVDPHTHINPHAPAAATLADVLGYHYYTELAHSAGLPREAIEEPGIDPREKVRRLVAALEPLENTIQYSWLIEMLREFFDFQDDRLTLTNWEAAYDVSAARMASPGWADDVLQRSKLSAVFLTNDFDDPLTGFDTARYVPCLRTDDLVFHLDKPETVNRLTKATQLTPHDAASLRTAIGRLFEHFVKSGARACAISLPPDFTPTRVEPAAADAALQHVLLKGPSADAGKRRELSHFIFWTLAEFCNELRLPFDLMIGVNRSVYETGVHQGRDLYDSRVSLIQYRALFNAFPRVTFPISILASVTNQELVSYAWIFPNVVAHGHWWYSNTPAYIEHDLAARLEAIPQTKIIGYYSDMYKLEFALPKFNMFKRILAKVLAERFVVDRGWSETRALELARRVLIDNTHQVFGVAPR